MFEYNSSIPAIIMIVEAKIGILAFIPCSELPCTSSTYEDSPILSESVKVGTAPNAKAEGPQTNYKLAYSRKYFSVGISPSFS